MYIIDKDGQKQTVSVYTVNDDIHSYAPREVIQKETRRQGKNRKHNSKTTYRAEPIFLDTETSHTSDNAYGWVHQWAAVWGTAYIIGRSAQSLANWLAMVDSYTDGMRTKEKRTIVYVHNLAYDWQYIKEYLPGDQEVFAVKSRKVLCCRFSNIELRCSYLLTGKSLAKWGADNKVDHPKLVGTYDYDIVRYPDTHISDEEWAYQLNDVTAQREAWHIDRKNDGYTIATVPLTKTGFVRETVRQMANTVHGWNDMVQALTPDWHLYNIAQNAYQAGYAHGNRFEVDTAGIIGHRDYKSSYPARMVLCKYPMGKWENFHGTLEDITKAYTDKYAMLIVLKISDVKLRSNCITAPILPYSKLIGKSGCWLDNGRVLRMVDGEALYCCTDIDFHLFTEQYTANMELIEAYTSKKGMLPMPYRKLVIKYFTDKETLKHADPTSYQLAKEIVNGLYGMGCQKTVQDKQVYHSQEAVWAVEKAGQSDYTKAVKKLVVPYVWGLWTTAEARLALITDIKRVGYENYLYCDTDSIFYLETEENKKALEKANRGYVALAKRLHGFVNESYLGVFDMEDDYPITRFRQLHAKCYAFENRDGLHVTIAGVNRKSARTGRTNAEELGCIDNLVDGFVFRECGGTGVVYNEQKPTRMEIDGHSLFVASSVVIVPSEYRVSDTRNYEQDYEELERYIDTEII